MEAKICYIKDKDGSTVSPVTSFDSVVDEQGNNLNDYKKKLYNVTIPAEGWTGTGPYTKTVEVTGIKETDMVNMYPVWSTTFETRQQEKQEYAKISVINSGVNSVQLICDEEAPTLALNVRIEVTY